MIDELEELRVELTDNMPTIQVTLDLPASIQAGYHEAQKARARLGQDIQTLKQYLAGIILQEQIDAHWVERMSKR